MNAPLLLPAPPVREALKGFSTKSGGGCSVQGCPKPGLASLDADARPGSEGKAKTTSDVIPDKPCNLVRMKLVEASASPKWEPGARSADFEPGGERRGTRCPIRLRSGVDVFQITAPSRREPPRTLNLTVEQDAWCGDQNHQYIAVTGPGIEQGTYGLTAKVPLHREPLDTDNVHPADQVGFFTLVNMFLQKSRPPQAYEIRSVACGLPPKAASAPLSDAVARVQVFPADKYKLELEIPAFLKGDTLKLEGALKSDNWKTDKDRAEEKEALREKEIKAEAKSYYKEYKQALNEVGVSKSDVMKFVADQAKRKSGEDDHKFVHEIEAALTQTDGSTKVKFPGHDVYKLVRQVRQLEESLKDITNLVAQCTRGGFGASLEAEVQALVLALEAQWGWCEHTDERVYWRWEASVDVWIVKAKIKFSIGVRYAGFADLYLQFTAEGALGLNAEAKLEDPEGNIEWATKPKPKGELKGSGMLKSELFWAVSGETGVKCEWTPKFDDMTFMQNGRVLGGKLAFERSPVVLVTKVSCRVFGAETTRTETPTGKFWGGLVHKGVTELNFDELFGA